MSPRKASGTAEITPEGRAALQEAENDALEEAVRKPLPGTKATDSKAAVYPVADADIPDLDDCPVGSKLVATEQGTVLATPMWERMLPRSHPAGRLPTGARIQKIGEGVYRGIQLDAGVDHPALVTATAVDAVSGFVKHFHG